LVAMAITVVLVSITVSLTAVALDTWRGARNEVRAARQGKMMLDSLGRDLEAVIIRRGGDAEWLSVIADKDDVGPEGEPSPNSSSLVFFTAAPDRYNGNVGDATDDKGGNVSLVSYQLAYGDPIFGDQENINSTTFVLYRDLIDPDTTFDRYLGSEDLESAFSQRRRAGYERSDAYVCENIYEMTIVFVIEYEDPTDGLTTVRVPVMGTARGGEAAQRFTVNGEGIEKDSRDTVEYSSGRIVAVDLSITVLSDTGMRIIKNSPFKNEQKKAEFLAKNSYQYTKSIRVPHS